MSNTVNTFRKISLVLFILLVVSAVFNFNSCNSSSEKIQKLENDNKRLGQEKEFLDRDNKRLEKLFLRDSTRLEDLKVEMDKIDQQISEKDKEIAESKSKVQNQSERIRKSKKAIQDLKNSTQTKSGDDLLKSISDKLQ